MKTSILPPVLILSSSLPFLSCGPLAGVRSEQQAIPQSVIVVFRDGAQVVVNNWAFEYQYGEWDSPPGAMTRYYPSYKRTSDLVLKTGVAIERGITVDVERKIEAREIVNMEFRWYSPNSPSSISEIIINLASGESLRQDEIKAARSFLSKHRYVVSSIHLVGKASFRGTPGPFEARIDGPWANDREPKDQFTEIRFRSK